MLKKILLANEGRPGRKKRRNADYSWWHQGPLSKPWRHQRLPRPCLWSQEPSVTLGSLVSVTPTPRAAWEDALYAARATDPCSEGFFPRGTEKVLSNMPTGAKMLPMLFRAELGQGHCRPRTNPGPSPQGAAE